MEPGNPRPQLMPKSMTSPGAVFFSVWATRRKAARNAGALAAVAPQRQSRRLASQAIRTTELPRPADFRLFATARQTQSWSPRAIEASEPSPESGRMARP